MPGGAFAPSRVWWVTEGLALASFWLVQHGEFEAAPGAKFRARQRSGWSRSCTLQVLLASCQHARCFTFSCHRIAAFFFPLLRRLTFAASFFLPAYCFSFFLFEKGRNRGKSLLPVVFTFPWAMQRTSRILLTSNPALMVEASDTQPAKEATRFKRPDELEPRAIGLPCTIGVYA